MNKNPIIADLLQQLNICADSKALFCYLQLVDGCCLTFAKCLRSHDALGTTVEQMSITVTAGYSKKFQNVFNRFISRQGIPRPFRCQLCPCYRTCAMPFRLKIVLCLQNRFVQLHAFARFIQSYLSGVAKVSSVLTVYTSLTFTDILQAMQQWRSVEEGRGTAAPGAKFEVKNQKSKEIKINLKIGCHKINRLTLCHSQTQMKNSKRYVQTYV